MPCDDVLILDEKQPEAILDVTALQNTDEAILKDRISSIFNPIRPNEARSRDPEKQHTNKWYVLIIVAYKIGGC